MFRWHNITILALTALLVLFGVALPAKASNGLLDGYFIYTTSSDSSTRKMLEDIKSTGASTVITFGTRLRPAKLTNGKPEGSAFADCIVNGTGCVSAQGLPVRSVFTYEEQGTWNTLKCGNDATVSRNGKKYTLHFIPTDNSGCAGKQYDVVVSRDASADSNSKTGHLLRHARTQGLQVFLGMPAPVQRSDQAWLPDVSYLSTLEKFTARWLKNVTSYGQGSQQVVGFYHHAEMPVSPSPTWKPVLSVYRAQNKAVSAQTPGKRTLVSPYLDARRSNAARTQLSTVQQGMRAIVGTSSGVSMIVAPQDGQGTGKVGAFTPAMRSDPVDAPSAAVAGKGAYSSVYEGSTGDYMRQIVAGASGAEVWLNAELMTGSTRGARVCEGASNGRGGTDIARVQRQIGVGKVPGVRRTIGFMWTPYVICGGNQALLPELQKRPSPTHIASASNTRQSQPQSPSPRTPSPKTSSSAPSKPVPDETVKSVQQNLLELGYQEVGSVDGFSGPKTKSAVTLFQQDAQYPVTGVADSTTLDQTRQRLTEGWTRPVQHTSPEPEEEEGEEEEKGAEEEKDVEEVKPSVGPLPSLDLLYRSQESLEDIDKHTTLKSSPRVSTYRTDIKPLPAPWRWIVLPLIFIVGYGVGWRLKHHLRWRKRKH